MLGSCFNLHLTIFRSAFSFLRPGGWFEMQDFAYPFPCVDSTMRGSAFERWLDCISVGLKKLNKDFGRATRYAEYMEERGFVEVKQKLLSWPIGTWPRDEKMKLLGA